MAAHRVDSLDVSPIRRLFEAAAPGAVHLGLGEPRMDPPREIRDALAAAAMEGPHGYGPSTGLPELQRAIADLYRDRWDGLKPQQVIITPGSNMGLFALHLALLDPGTEILVSDPGFTLNERLPRFAEASSVPFPTPMESGFEPDLPQLEAAITPKTRAILINTPNNPTGAVWSRRSIEAVAEIADRRGLWLISDEAYDRLVFEGEHHTIAGMSPRGIVVNTFSKTLAIPGWRIGFMIVPPELVQPVRRAVYHMCACPSSPIQRSVLPFFNDPDGFASRVRDEMRRRCEAMLKGLEPLRPWLDLVSPKGALYAFPRMRVPMKSMELCEALLHDANVVTAPGSAFGSRGEGHIRFSFGAPVPAITEGLDRIRAWLQKRFPR